MQNAESEIKNKEKNQFLRKQREFQVNLRNNSYYTNIYQDIAAPEIKSTQIVLKGC